MNDIKVRIDDLNQRMEKLIEVLDIPKKEEELKKLEGLSTDPKLWDDQDNAKTVLQNLSNLKDEIKEIEDVSETLEIVSLMDDEVEVNKLEKQIGKLELKSYLSGLYDNKNTIITIHAGQGGTELWTGLG